MKSFYSLLILFLMIMKISAQKENNQLDSLLSSVYKINEPGAAVAVVNDGNLIFEKGYGIADLDSKSIISASTNFNICSMTKQFTAYGILLLQKQKKISLDDKLNKYFPDFNPKVAEKVSIRNLLTHSSGIVDHYSYVDKKQFTQFWDKDVYNAVRSVDSSYSTAGSKYQYSNTAFCLLARVIEKVSGKSFSDFVKENIYNPLKMNASDVIKPDFNISNRAYGYEFENDTFKIADAKQSLFFSTQGDGGIYTSINDYLKWITAIQTGKGIDADLIKEAQSKQFTIDAAKDISYGYGWFVAGNSKNIVVYHTGSNGGFRTIVVMHPAKKYSVVIFSNRTGIDLEDLVRKINKIYGIDDAAFVKLDSLIS
ncbi:MAG: class A beta-lactamase-related serine hydrolase [Ignavibacteriales bacterium]|nr:MAG: class A beta-lactamase-related serine hydrolase [Ignavibacteriales bacterium]